MTINASESTVRATAAALSRAALLDDRITDGDPARIAAWAEVIERHGLEQSDLLQGVARHYDRPGTTTIKVGDLVGEARECRRDRAEREKAQPAAIAAPDTQLGNLPIAGADGPPVPDAYEVNGAVDRPCATCKAGPMEPCINKITGSPRKIPCLARLRAPRK